MLRKESLHILPTQGMDKLRTLDNVPFNPTKDLWVCHFIVKNSFPGMQSKQGRVAHLPSR